MISQVLLFGTHLLYRLTQLGYFSPRMNPDEIIPEKRREQVHILATTCLWNRALNSFGSVGVVLLYCLVEEDAITMKYTHT